MGRLLWLGRRDSNPDKQSQSLLSYRWTTSQQDGTSKLPDDRESVKPRGPLSSDRVAASLRIDAEQRFTCSQCGRCCRRPWEIVVTASEAELYRSKNAARWYRDTAAGDEGTPSDPFEAIAGTRGFHKIRKRDDGACGFLSPENRCRLHEELGGLCKPLTCRMFPYRFHPAGDEIVVETSFCCPTTIANVGATVVEQRNDVQALRAEWFAVYPEKPATRRFAGGRSIDDASLALIRAVATEILDRRDSSGDLDLRSNAQRLARLVEDWTRSRVLELKGGAFEEYLALTGRFAAKSEKPVTVRPPSRLARLLQRGFLFVVVAARIQNENKTATGLRLALRSKLFRLLAHFHGLGPAVDGIDLAAPRQQPVDVNAVGIQDLVRHFLRSGIASLGTGKRPVVDELALAFSYVNAACALASMRAQRTGSAIDAPLFSEALMEAVDLTHADDRGLLGRILAGLSGGVLALDVFASTASSPVVTSPA